MFGGTTSYSERANYILKDALIIIVAFQAAQRTLGMYENFLDAIFGILFIFVPPNKRLDPVFCSIWKWLIRDNQYQSLFPFSVPQSAS